ncbi:MAG: hypothetical protein JSW06_01170 [Thermoplasmatales archaeon]|nr:MAG: hypothetical protein JSW06_01170 [Thermoplasmatales archaeon]
MKKKLIGIFVCMLLIGTVLPVTGMVTNGISENNNSNETVSVNGNYNLVQQLNPTKKFFPRIYLSGTRLGNRNIATLDAYVINEGPDDSSDYTLELKWTRILGRDSKVLLDVEVGEYEPIEAGGMRHVDLNLECWVNNNFFNFGINVYEAQITNTIDDLNLGDNTASFRYIVIGY